ncbi:MAG: DUF6505 family protein [Kiloniellales bacterium]|nr:DUF6505 family protein [Kiloniellales bacterium]
MRFPRTIRLDSSDPQVFEKAADPGEPAVPGGFAFADVEPAQLTGKRRLAFASGWLGTVSFGRSSLVEIAEISEAEFFQVVERLARHFVADYGAPDLTAALPAARAAADDAASLCEHKLHSLLAVERDWENGRITERFRLIEPERAADHAKIWEIVEDPEA